MSAMALFYFGLALMWFIVPPVQPVCVAVGAVLLVYAAVAQNRFNKRRRGLRGKDL